MSTTKQLNLIEQISIHPTETKVDRDQCVVRNVKVLGKESPNSHGLPDVSGTVYTLECMQEALPLYSGRKVFIDHPERSNPTKERSIRDGVGKLFDPRIEAGEIYADLWLVPSHEFTPQILDCSESERLNDMFSLSHNAQGQGEVEDGKFVVRSIPSVRSVDLVSAAATTRSLFESQENKTGKIMTKKTITLREAIARHKDAKFRAVWAKLLEDDDYASMSMPDMGASDSGAGDAGADAGAMDTGADADAGAAAGGDDSLTHEDHLAEMIKKIVLDDSMSADERVAKIKKALALITDGEGEGGDGDNDADDKPPFGGDTDSDSDAGADTDSDSDSDSADTSTPKDTSESRETKMKTETKDFSQTKEYKELLQLRNEKKVRELCESLQFVDYDVTEFKALCVLDDTDRKAYIKKAKERRTAVAPKKAPTVPSTVVPKHIQESQEAGLSEIPGTNPDTAKRAQFWRA